MSDKRLRLTPREILGFEELGVAIGDVLAESRLSLHDGFLNSVRFLAHRINRLSRSDPADHPPDPSASGARSSAHRLLLMFILPPLCHHLRFPMDYKQRSQFFWRSNQSLVCGIVPPFSYQ